MQATIDVDINETRHRLAVHPGRRLLDVLREDLDLTGAKPGCGEGECGACTVLVDGRPMRSCLTAVHDVAGRRVTTIEGLARDGRLHPVQEAFLEAEAFQCGYCTPGMIVSAAGLLREQPDPSAADVVRYLQGHVCRCGAYPRIVAAVRAAAAAMNDTADEREAHLP